jgi:hypothetical protein
MNGVGAGTPARSAQAFDDTSTFRTTIATPAPGGAITSDVLGACARLWTAATETTIPKTTVRVNVFVI